MQSIVTRLFRIRRTVQAALKVLRDCCHVERQLRLAARLANVPAVDGAFLAAARGSAFVRRWRAQDAIIRAGADMILACIAIDKSSLTARDKLDLLGCWHRFWVQPPEVEFARLVGDGWEIAPLDVVATPDPRMGLLKVAGLAVMDHQLLQQHDALRPVVEAIDARETERQCIAAAAMRGAIFVDGPGTLQ
jgi:hypothetical protein